MRLQDPSLVYRPPEDSYDEMSLRGEPRDHWRSFLQSLKSMSPEDHALRLEQMRRLMRENGVTFNVHGDPRGHERPWQLDPIPLLLPEAEWSAIEQGLIQRARLFRALLEDLYGEQIVLAQGWLPAALVFAHSHFIRASHGLPIPARCRPLVVATDLGRAVDGRMFVLSHRASAPHGCGYALENRLVMARIWPDLFRSCRVKRVAPFFSSLRAGLHEMATNRDEPRIVLLTRGPESETYFEQAYMAQYLGYPLVEAGDLTVRDNRVFLKLLEGLQPVHVILRWMDGTLCDPLEIPSRTLAGVPGLVQAVRTGNVVVANSLGSGLAETPALGPYLPGLCRFLLGEELSLHSVPTWWCGEPRGLEHVLANLPRLVVKPAFSSPGVDPVFGEALSSAQREQLSREITARPHLYVGQEQVPLSTAPAWGGDRLVPRHLVLRTYVASFTESFGVLPGALARVSPSVDSLVVSAPQGGGSKDTWILAQDDEEPLTVRSTAEASVPLSRGGDDLPSRMADNLFWLGRYSERADGLARFLRACLARRVESTGLDPSVLLGKKKKPSDLLVDLGNTLDSVTRLSKAVRGSLSGDSWRMLNGLAELREDLGKTLTGRHQEKLDHLITQLSAFSGAAHENMTRSHAWRFLDIGRRIERGLQVIARVAPVVSKVHRDEVVLLEVLLEVADSVRTYRRRYPVGLQAPPVIDLLLVDETNPRSLGFSLTVLESHLRELPNSRNRVPLPSEHRLLLASLTELRLADLVALCRQDREDLERLITRLRKNVLALSEAVTVSYLTHLDASQFNPAQ